MQTDYTITYNALAIYEAVILSEVERSGMESKDLVFAANDEILRLRCAEPVQSDSRSAQGYTFTKVPRYPQLAKKSYRGTIFLSSFAKATANVALLH